MAARKKKKAFKPFRTRTFLNLSKKSKKYATELKTRVHFKNNGQMFVDDSGEPDKLNSKQAAYRMGYL